MQPIHFAAAGGHVNIIDALVTDHKVDPNIKVSYLHMHMCILLARLILCTIIKNHIRMYVIAYSTWSQIQ